MDDRSLDLGLVADLSAESFGEPGQRTFRLLAHTAEGQVSLWLEKEQVVMLGSAIEELLERIPTGYGRDPSSTSGGTFVGELEVRLGSLSIGYNSEQAGFLLEASDFESAFDISGIRLLTTRQQLETISDQIDSIVSASRPRCPLCGRVLSGDAHFCPESNGHGEYESVE